MPYDDDDTSSHLPPPRRTVAPGGEPLVLGGRTVQPGDPVGDWVFERELGSGAMARVLLVRDAAGQRVALKLLRPDRVEAGLARFRHEFHVLSRLHHPNIVTVHALGELDGVPYIAMEYVAGTDLHQLVRELHGADDERRWARARQVLVDLCRALSALHRRGLVHRDLKPSNVLVTPQGICKLTDFGIVKDMDGRVDTEGATSLVGTWAYASPEHIAGQPVDHRSDLYALGVILFVLLTGRRPFVAENMAGYLEAHRSRPAPRAARVRPGVPPLLDEICDRLLSKAPRDRFQSAREVLYRLDADDLDDADDEELDWSPPWVGPRAVLDHLDAALARLGRGYAGVLRIVASDGLGRTRVLGELASRARGVGIPVHAVGFGDDGSPLGGVLDLARQVARDLDKEAARPLAAALAGLEGGPLRPETRRALLDALAGGLVALTRRRGRVLVVDDVHLAGPPRADALRAVLRGALEGGARLLVALAGRPGSEAEADAWPPDVVPVDISLVPLTAGDVRGLVASLVGSGRSAEVLGQRLHADSEGNPSFVVEFLRSLVAQGLVARQERGWGLVLQADEIAAGRLEIPPSIRAVLRRRVSACAPADREILDVLALGALPATARHVADVLDREEPEVAARLERLQVTGLTHRAGPAEAGRWALAHGKLAEVLRLDLPPARAVALHRALATTLQAGGSTELDVVRAIGEHLRLAGDAAGAHAHLAIAAARFAAADLPTEAWGLVEQAASVEVAARAAMSEDRWAALRGLLLRARAQAQRTRAEWGDAVETWRALRTLAASRGDEVTATEAQVGMASCLRRQGRVAEARVEATAALAEARRLKLRGAVADALVALAGIAWSQGDLAAAEQLAQEGLVVAQGPETATARAQLLMCRGAVHALSGQVATATRSWSEAENLFRSLGMHSLRALALANLAELAVWVGDGTLGRSRALEATELAERVQSPLARCTALRALGTACADLGHSCEAHAALMDALSTARRIGLGEEALAASVALVGLAMDRADPTTALRVGADALALDPGHDPEHWQPVLHAQLARVLGRRRPLEALSLLREAEGALPSLPPPRRQQVRLAAAKAWLALGDRERAQARALEVVQDPAARTFRLLQVEARALLVECTASDDAQRHRKAGLEVVRELAAALPTDDAARLLRRPSFRALAVEVSA